MSGSEALPGSTSGATVAHGTSSDGPRTHVVVCYSDDPAVRDQVRTAIGRHPAADLGRVEWVECATGPEVIKRVDAGGVDLCILDGEAWPTGGMGLAKQMKDELADPPPALVLIARRDDAWLATWSQADAVVPHPVDAPEITAAAADLLRRREAGHPVRRAIRY
jgi:DNA-binding response OmpR family regulator